MRNILFAAVLLSASPALAETVTATGCPMKGVETGCIVIKGDDGKVYNITSASPKPKIGGKAIKLTGKISDKVSICNQGTILEDIKYQETTTDCPAGDTK